MSIDNIPFSIPHDFEKRAVEAALSNKSLVSEFKELDLSWSYKRDLVEKAEEWCSNDEGLDDILLFVNDIKIAISLADPFSKVSRMFMVESIEALKEMIA